VTTFSTNNKWVNELTLLMSISRVERRLNSKFKWGTRIARYQLQRIRNWLLSRPSLLLGLNCLCRRLKKKSLKIKRAKYSITPIQVDILRILTVNRTYQQLFHKCKLRSKLVLLSRTKWTNLGLEKFHQKLYLYQSQLSKSSSSLVALNLNSANSKMCKVTRKMLRRVIFATKIPT